MRRAAVLMAVLVLLGRAWSQDPAPAPAPDVMSILMRSLTKSEDPKTQINILKGINAALRGRPNMPAPTHWAEAYQKLSKSTDPEVRQQANALAVVFGSGIALDEMRKNLRDAAAGQTARETALDSLVAAKDAATVPILHQLLSASGPLRSRALRALAAFDDPHTPAALLANYASFDSAERRDALNTMVSRLPFARALLLKMETKEIAVSDLTASAARRLQGFRDPEIDAWLKANWGALGSTSAEKTAEIGRYLSLLTPAALDNADPSRGRAVFALTCQQCHTLFGVGGKVGPELTASPHTDVDYILENVINPNGFIGKDYQNVAVQTADGQVISGVVRAEDSTTVTVRTIAEDVVVPRANILDLTLSETSMMPEGLLQPFKDDEVRDLVAYLRSSAQVPLLATPHNGGDFFAGNSLQGWEGNTDVWKVEQGELVGKRAGHRGGRDPLLSEMTVEDGALTMEIKLIGQDARAAILFRAERVEGGGVRGPRFVLGQDGGRIEDARNRSGISPVIVRSGKTDGWHRVEMQFSGTQVLINFDGEKCGNLDDPEGNRRGILGFEWRSPGPSEIRIRNLKLEVPPAP